MNFATHKKNLFRKSHCSSKLLLLKNRQITNKRSIVPRKIHSRNKNLLDHARNNMQTGKIQDY